MTKTLASILVACTLPSQCIDALTSLASLRRHATRSLQTTKYCGTDALSAYLSCTADTTCADDGDCNAGETCWELDCPVIAADPTDAGSAPSNVSSTNANATTNSTNATISNAVSSVANATATAADAIATNATYNTTESSSITIDPNHANSTDGDSATTLSPTVAPLENWTDFDYATLTKFCGPKYVGGYDLAVSQCGPSTVCGMTVSADHYGASGNDCPHGFMCYSDIVCGNGPGPRTTTSTSAAETTSSVDATAAGSLEDETSAMSMVSAATATTTTTTTSTTVSETTTREPETEDTAAATITAMEANPMLLTTRASFCGSFYAEAVLYCGSKTMCASSVDCEEKEECFEDISCTYDPNAEGNDDGKVGDTEESGGQEQQQNYAGVFVTNNADGNENQATSSEEGGGGFSFAQNESQNIDSNSATSMDRRISRFVCFCGYFLLAVGGSISFSLQY